MWGVSESARFCPGFDDGIFSWAAIEQAAGGSGEWVENVCIYIQVQKVYVLYLFLRNRRIFLKKNLTVEA
jgi:hypothetical protein